MPGSTAEGPPGRPPQTPVVPETGRARVVILLVLALAGLRPLVDLAMTLAFVSAPLFAYLNYRVISTATLPAAAVPPRWLRLLSWVGLAFLTCFSILFLVVHFGCRR